MGKIILGYWDIRGRGAPARMMLEYGGLDWEDKKYPFGPAPNFISTSSWQSVKQQSGLDFPNLPYLIDGDVKLTESWAILRYIGRKIGLAPSTEKEEYEADMLQGVIDSLMMNALKDIYNPKFEELKAGLWEQQEAKMGEFEKFLQGRHFLVGPNLRFVDFFFFQALDHHRHIFPGILDNYPNLKAFLRRFETEKRIAAYMKSDKYYVFPMFAPMAYWPGQK